MPFSLPTVLHWERSLDGSEPGEQLPLSEGSLTLYLDAREGLSRIEVLGETGEVLAALPAEAFERAETAPGLRTLQLAGASSPRELLADAFPHIESVGADADLGIAVANPLSGVLRVVEIGPKAGPAIQDALSRMSRAALGAVRTVAVADFKASSGVGLTYGSWSHRAYHAELLDLQGFGWFAHYVFFEHDGPLPSPL